MPYLSIVLPCYNVQAYVRECLDSILDQPFRDVEVIAIDDASPDHVGEILDEYAARDERVSVVHLTENVGLGEGRNIGLTHATGEYVLFVDSDDYLAPRSLEAIADRLKETQPDVMFFDFARSYYNGIKRRSGANDLFREPPAPDTFTLKERLSVMYLFMVAWNKAYRREFLNSLGATFTKGWFEDIPLTYPAIMAAERISLLDRVCYYYRQRRGGGSILSTAHAGHSIIIQQFEHVFAYIDRHAPAYDWFKPYMFRRAMLNELAVMKNPSLIPRKARKQFFEMVCDQHDRHRPEGWDPAEYKRYVPPEIKAERAEDTTYRLLERRRFRRYVALHTGIKNAKLLRKQARVGLVRAQKAKKWIARRTRTAGYRVRVRRAPNPNLAVFSSNLHRAPSGSPLAIHEELRRRASAIQTVWAVRYTERDLVPSDVAVVVDGSRAHFNALARAKYVVNDVEFPDFVVKRPGRVYLQTTQGTPLATVGLDLQGYPTAREVDFDAMLESVDRWDVALSANRYTSEVLGRAFPSRYRTLELGLPCNDRYYTAGAEEIARVREHLRIPAGKTAILYAPAEREYSEDWEPNFDLVHLARALPDDQLLMVRGIQGKHPEFAALETTGKFLDVSEHPSTEDVCLAADVLVTDYASIMFDYANLARPIIVYADDFETYGKVHGIYFDIFSQAPGPVATTDEELIEILRERRFESAESALKLDSFRRRFCEWDDGHAAERVVETVFLGGAPGPIIPYEDRMSAPRPSAATPGSFREPTAIVTGGGPDISPVEPRAHG
ncbi:MAG TPA: bifunctional glycosyltransferase family 2 protein/CDP-glycerol:glycerophosphate glycerophosphotransferase [Actinomycetota bacterium]